MVSYAKYASKIKKAAHVKGVIVKFRVLIISALSLTTASITTYSATKGVVTSPIVLSSGLTYGEKIVVDESNVILGDILYYEYLVDGSWVTDEPTLAGDYAIRAVTEKTFNKERRSKEYPFTIAKRNISIDINDSTIDYGKYPTSYKADLAYNDIISICDFEYDDISLATPKVRAIKDSVVIVDNNGNDVTNNYEIDTPYFDTLFNKKDIVVEPLSITKVYDSLDANYNYELLETTYNDLMYGDKITFNYSILDSNNNVVDKVINSGKYTIRIDSESLKITNGTYDTTKNYDIEIKDGYIDVKVAEAIITTSSDTKVYDGSELTCYKYSDVSGLLTGDYLLLDETKENEFASITNVGNVDNILFYKVFNSEQVDVTSNYLLTYNYGTLEVTPKEIEIKASNQIGSIYGDDYAYDSSIFEYVSDSKLVEGETISIEVKYKDASGNLLDHPTDANTYEVIATKVNYLSANKDNYIITLSSQGGQFVISPRDITIKAVDQDNVTYGDSYDYDKKYELIDSTLQYNDKFELTGVIYIDSNGNICNPIHAGVYDVLASEVSFTKGIASNYNITYSTEPVTFTIDKRDIEIILNNKEAIFFEDYSYDDAYDNFNNVSDINLANNDKLKVATRYEDELGELVTPYNVGNYYINLVVEDSIVSNDLGNTTRNVTDDYNVTLKDRTILTINPRPIKLKAIDQGVFTYGDEDTYTYDTTSYAFDSVEGQYTSLAINDELTVSIKYVLNGNEVVSPIDANTYEIYVVDANFTSGDASNYDVSYSLEPAKLQINKLDVVVTPKDIDDMIYGNQPSYVYSEDNYESIDKTLPYNEHLWVNVYYLDENNQKVVPSDVGTYRIVIDKENTTINDNRNVLDNYNLVQEETVTFTINKKQINVVLNDKTFIYGEDIVYEDVYGNYYNYLDLPYGEQLKVAITYKDASDSVVTPKDSGTYYIHVIKENTLIKDVYGNEISALNNYELTYDYSTLTINKKAITITPKDQYGIVYGESYAYSNEVGNYSNTPELQYNELLKIAIYYKKDGSEVTPLHKGYYQIHINFEDSKVYDSDGTNQVSALKNYTITQGSYGTLEIVARKILLKAKNQETVTYGDADSYPYDTSKYSLIEKDNYYSTLAYNDTLTVGVKYYKEGNEVTPKDAGTYYIYVVASHFKDSEENNIDSYNDYDVTYSDEASTFTINRFEVKVTPNDIVDVDFGEDYEYEYKVDNYSYLSKTLPYNEHLWINVYYSTDEEGNNVVTPYNVGDYYINFDYENSLIDNNRACKDNYIISQEGTQYFTIKPRKILVKAITQSDITYGDNYSYNQGYQLVTKEGYYNTLATSEAARLTSVSYKDVNEVSVTTPKDAGTYYIFAEGITFDIGNINNYDVEYYKEIDATLIINKRKIVVAAKDVYKDYNSKERYVFGESYEYDYTRFELVEGTTLGYSDESIRLSQIKYTENVDNGNEVIPYNAATYRVYAVAIEFISGNENNYYVVYSTTKYGKFIILKRSLLVGVEANDTITYGDTYTYDGSYVLIEKEDYFTNLVGTDKASLNVIYKDDNGNKVNPKDVGTYSIIAKELSFTSGLASNYEIDYSKDVVGSLTINKKAIDITLLDIPSKMVFTGKPQGYYETNNNYSTTSSFAFDETLTKVKVKYYDVDNSVYISKPTYVGKYMIILDEDNTFIDGTSTPINKNYNVTSNTLTFEIYEQTLHVVTSSETKVYDGATLTGSIDYVVAELATGNTFVVGNKTSITNVSDGPADNIISYDIVDNDGNSVLANYNIIETIGTLTINPLPITISINELSEKTKVYDSIAYDYANNSFTTDKDLVLSNESLSVKVRYEDEEGNKLTSSPTDAGSYNIYIYDYTLVSTHPDNYTITLSEAALKLTITKATINISPYNQEYVYGKNVDYSLDKTINGYSTNYASVSNLGINDRLQIATYYKDNLGNVVATPKDAGTYYIYVDATNSIIYDKAHKDGRPLLDNYVLFNEPLAYSTLTISRKTITISPLKMANATYGESYSYSDEIGNIEELSLPYDGKIKITVNYTNQSGVAVIPREVGTYTINVNTVTLYEGDTLCDISKNYNVTYGTNTFKIVKRDLTIVLFDSYDVTYDALTHGYEIGLAKYDSVTNLAKNDSLGINDVDFDIDLVVVYRLYSSETKYKDYDDAQTNVGKYYVIVNADSSLINGVKLSKNYNVAYQNDSYINIEKREVSVVTNSASKVYDGTALTGNVTEVTNIVSTHNYQIASQASIIDFGSIENTISVTITDSKNKDVTSNYEFVNPSYGTLSIKKREIIVSLNDDLVNEKEYDGEAFDYSNNGYKLGENKFVGKDYITVNVRYELTDGTKLVSAPKDAGKYNIYLDSIDKHITNEDNYDIKGDVNGYINLTITTRKVAFIVSSSSRVYDGTDTNSYSVSFVHYDVVNDKQISGTAFYGNDVGSYDITLTTYKDSEIVNPVNAGVYDIICTYTGSNSNYEIVKVVNNTLTINKRKITISPTIETTSKLYDGKAFTYEYVDNNYKYIEGEGVVEGDVIKIHVLFNGTSEVLGDKYEAIDVKDVVTEACKYTVSIDKSTLLVNGQANVNYEITYGTIDYEITARSITVYNGDYEFTYDGTVKEVDESMENGTVKVLVGSELIEELGHKVVKSRHYKFGYIDVCDTTNGQKVSIIDKTTSKEMTHNYNITLSAGKYVINPKELSVTITPEITSKTYDGEYIKFNTLTSDSVTGLVNGQFINFKSFKYPKYSDAGVYTNDNLATYYATNQVFKIYTKQDFEIDDYLVNYSNYKVSVTMASDITINKANITVTVKDANPVDYTGNEVKFKASLLQATSEEGKININVTLADKNSSVSYIDEDGNVVSKVVNAGVYYALIDKHEILINGTRADVENKNLNVIIADTLSSKITIESLVMKDNYYLATPTNTFEYDGERHYSTYIYFRSSEYNDSSFNSVFGYADKVITIVYLDNDYQTYVQNIGDSKANVVAYKLIDEDGNDVTNNFVIPSNKVQYGTISIIDTYEMNWLGKYYDGQPLSMGEFTKGVYYSTLTYSSEVIGFLDSNLNEIDYAPVDVGTYYAIISDPVFYRNGIQLTSEQIGSMKITNSTYKCKDGKTRYILYDPIWARTIRVKPIDIGTDKNNPLYYSGVEVHHSPDQYEIFYGSLVEGHTLSITTDASGGVVDGKVSRYLDSSVEVNITSVKLVDENGNDISRNYTIYYSYNESIDKQSGFKKSSYIGKIKVQKRDIEVSVLGGVFTYDGSVVSVDNGYTLIDYENTIMYNYNLSGYGLLDGDYISSYIVTTRVDGITEKGMVNKVRFTVISPTLGDVSKAYEFKFQNNTENKVIVNKISITVTSGSATGEYVDGEEVAVPTYIVEGTLLEGDYLEVTTDYGPDNGYSLVTDEQGVKNGVDVAIYRYVKGVKTYVTRTYYNVNEVEGTIIVLEP